MNLFCTSKKLVRAFAVLTAILYIGNNFSQENPKQFHLQTILTNPALRVESSKFIDNVLRQIPSSDFFALADQLHVKGSDEEIYGQLLGNINGIKPYLFPLYQLKALQNQKAVLGNQAYSLLKDSFTKQRPINGCLEIGTPGTYMSAIKKFLPITGQRYMMNDQERLTDRVQCGGFLPYNHFICLNDYAPIAPTDIADNSLDLVICFIGLHHIPKEKINDFVGSIKRVLKPGGIFILRDHNVINDDIKTLVYGAHSIFNLIATHESVESELNEYRNFQPLSYWITILTHHGFAIGQERLLQEGDPTLNTLIKCTKQAQTVDEHVVAISNNTQQQNNDYKRDISQTFLTSPEWFNVDAAQEYGNFINHTPFYEFPYMDFVKTYWKHYFASLKSAAQRKGSYLNLPFSYLLMNGFIGVSMTVEHMAKSLISAPIRWAFSGEESSTLLAVIEDKQHEIETLHPAIKVLQRYPHNLALIQLPRYKDFNAIMVQLPKTHIIFHEIAGNQEIQCKIRYYSSDYDILSVPYDYPSTHPDIFRVEFQWQVPAQPHYQYANISIPVKKLHLALQKLQKDHIEILYVHDF